MKLFILPAIAVCVIAHGNLANACSYQIDEAKKSTELRKVAIANLGGSKILSSSVSDFSFFESKPTRMCPDELTYNATVTVSYKNGLNECSVELAVKKVESWGESDQDTYTVSGRKNARCKK
jgi:hypothetical protein